MTGTTPWSPSRIRSVDRALETSTGTARVETDAGSAYVKMIGSPEGSQALFCDWVRTRAPALLEVPTFDVAVIDVNEAGLVAYPDGTTSRTGPAFPARGETEKATPPASEDAAQAPARSSCRPPVRDPRARISRTTLLDRARRAGTPYAQGDCP